MKKCILFFLLLLAETGYPLYGQSYTNSWVVLGQPYIKISFKSSGVYRLQRKDIESLPGAIGNPPRIQIYQRGVEISKTGYGLSDGSFDEGDYYEFYLRANQGEQDSVMYRPQSARPKTPVNIYSDESYIFVTVGRGAGKISSEYNYAGTGVTETYHIAKEMKVFSAEWSQYHMNGSFLPVICQSFFVAGEGHTGGGDTCIGEKE